MVTVFAVVSSPKKTTMNPSPTNNSFILISHIEDFP